MTGKWGKLFTKRPVLFYVFTETDLLQFGDDISIMFYATCRRQCCYSGFDFLSQH